MKAMEGKVNNWKAQTVDIKSLQKKVNNENINEREVNIKFSKSKFAKVCKHLTLLKNTSIYLHFIVLL